jgi:hypothetical protein
MIKSDGQPRGVHLVGSVPLRSRDEVFRTASAILGDRLVRIPDGETGDRSDWIGWQLEVLKRTPQFKEAPPHPNRYSARPQVQLVESADRGAVAFGPLGYAEAARASYAEFARLRQEGIVPAGLRFQVSLPTPFAVVNSFVARPDRQAVEPAYERRLLAELGEILDVIPHHDLAIQWDVAIEVGVVEGVIPSLLQHPKEEILQRLSRLSARVPEDVELGFHLCYGDLGHRHFQEPEDTSVLADLANGLSERIRRPIAWIHMPVPRARDDDAYFAPLRGLHLHPETQLYLGLVHYTDGVEGTARRITAAQRTIPRFGVATECGMGRRPPDTVPDLLAIHAAVAAPVTEGEPA